MTTRTIDPNKPHATRRDLAEHLGLTVRTIDSWLADSTNPLPRYQRGNTVRFKIAEVEAHLQKQKATSS